MSNPILHYFQTQVGQPLDRSLSPVGRWLRGTLVEASEGSITVDFVVRPEMTNPVGLLHGGSIALIMDDVIGASIFTLNRPHFYLSIDLKVDFLSGGARSGDTIRAKAWPIRQGKQLVHMVCELHKDGHLLAKGSSNMLLSNIPVQLPKSDGASSRD